MLEAIDMGSYRAEKRAVQQVQFADADATIDPLPAQGGSGPDCRIEHDKVRRAIVGLMKHDTDFSGCSATTRALSAGWRTLCSG
jgi:hypothetical protein